MDTKGNMTLYVGHTFDNITQINKVLKVYAIKKQFKQKRIKNEKARVTYKCV